MSAIAFDDGMDARTLPDLLVLLEVAKAGSITAAAGRLHTVQSNVTARIKKLERTLGASLLKREARGAKLTPAGEAAVAIAMRQDAILNDLRFAFSQGRQAPRRARLRLGAIETVAASRLPGLLAQFGRAYPHVDVSVHTGSSARLTDQVREGVLEAGFVSRPPRLAGLRSTKLFEDELIVTAPPHCRSLAEWQKEARDPLTVFVQRLGCSYTERLLGLLGAQPRPIRIQEMGTLEGIVGMVGRGLGIAALPRSFVDLVAPAGAIKRLALPVALRPLPIYLIATTEEQAAAVTNEFFGFCRKRATV